MMDLYKRVNLLDGTTLEKEIYALERDINSVWTSTVLGKKSLTGSLTISGCIRSYMFMRLSILLIMLNKYMQVQSILNPLAADLQGWRP